MRKRAVDNPAWVLWKSARLRAHKKRLEFCIRVEDITIPEFCPLLGLPLRRGVGGRSPNSPSLDRKDPKLGYVPGNVWVVSWRANQIKNDGTQEEFIRIVANWPK